MWTRELTLKEVSKWLQGPHPGGFFPRGPEYTLRDQTSPNCLCCAKRLCVQGSIRKVMSPAWLPRTMRQSRASIWLVTDPSVAHLQPHTHCPPLWPSQNVYKYTHVTCHTRHTHLGGGGCEQGNGPHPQLVLVLPWTHYIKFRKFK